MSSDEGEAEVARPTSWWTGPRLDVKYPLSLVYCGECSMPMEYCEYWPQTEKCKEWAVKHAPDALGRLTMEESGAGGDDAEGDEKKRQTRGGKGMMRAKKKKESGPKKIVISRSQRNKKKYVTVVVGLATFGIDLKTAAKKFGGKFACGSSVTGDDEIVIQGDVTDDLIDFIVDTWKDIDEDLIEEGGDVKRT